MTQSQSNTATAATSQVRLGAAVWAALIAGALFLMLEMAMMALMGQSPWGPPRMMAAIVLGQGVLPPPATFDMGVAAAAMMLHFALSILYAFVFALVAQRLSFWSALWAGAVFGLVLYGVNFYAFTALFPWFAMARGMGSIAGHVFYGLVLAGAYKALAK